MAMKPVYLLDTVHPRLPAGLNALGMMCHEAWEDAPGELWPRIADAYGLVIRSRMSLNAERLAALPSLRFIARVGAGLENIDLAAARARGIAVFNAPEGNRDAVGEHALGMLLALLHHLPRADREVREGIWRRAENRGTELGSLTVGIMGFGNTGGAFAEKLSGFGCRILAYDKYKSQYAPAGVEEVDMETLQAEAQVFSLHLPQSPETLGLVDADFLARFAHPIYLINTARGKALKTEALVDALRSGRVLGAALDVLEYEKSSFTGLFTREMPEPMRYLLQSERVMLSPHIAGWTHQSHQRMAEVLLEKIANWQQKGADEI